MNKLKRIFAPSTSVTTTPDPNVNDEKRTRRHLFRRSLSNSLFLPKATATTAPRPKKKMSWSHSNTTSTRDIDYRRMGSNDASEQRARGTVTPMTATDDTSHGFPSDLQSPVLAPPDSKVKTIGALALNVSNIVPAVGLGAGKDREPMSPQSATTRQNEADEYIQRAIQYHEDDQLEKATHYFKLAADKNSPLGLFLYGIALRHGWGCEPNPKGAVKYLQKAAQSAVYDLHASVMANPSIARDELVLAIYELGQCFLQGWGVPKNKTTAAYYFEIAANLGDPDAQNDLAFCYANAVGVKKDMKKAARYYRMAAAQGSEVMGNSWIWKDKYSDNHEDRLPPKRRGVSV